MREAGAGSRHGFVVRALAPGATALGLPLRAFGLGPSGPLSP